MSIFEKGSTSSPEESGSEEQDKAEFVDLGVGSERNKKTAEQLGINVEGMSDEEVEVAVQKKLGEVLGK